MRLILFILAVLGFAAQNADGTWHRVVEGITPQYPPDITSWRVADPAHQPPPVQTCDGATDPDDCPVATNPPACWSGAHCGLDSFDGIP